MVLVSHTGRSPLLGVTDPGRWAGLADPIDREMAFPSRIRDDAFTDWLSIRSSGNPTTASRIWAHLLDYEGPLTPPGITTRTLVLHNRDSMQREDEVRAVAAEIPGATFVQVSGADSYPIAGDVDLLIREIAEFVTGAPSALAPLRHVAAVLFTDLVDSTRRAVDEGDEHWRDLLDIHDRTVKRSVGHHGGRVVKYTGDGVLALMPSATSALETARSMQDDLGSGGFESAGIHVGDVDERGDDVSGLRSTSRRDHEPRGRRGDTRLRGRAGHARLRTSFRRHRHHGAQGIPEQWKLYRWLQER
jgi:class 3 adenylate cyclase